MNNNKNTAARLIAKALGINVSTVDQTTALGITPQWDSLAHMRIILALEKKLDRQLQPEEIVSISTTGDVTHLLETEVK